MRKLKLSEHLGMDDVNLNVNEAFEAMFYFLEEEYNINPTDDIGILLGSISWDIVVDGLPVDPAVKDQWKNAVSRVITNKKKGINR